MWWQTKPIKKKFKSSVVSVDFHPSGRLVAAGSTDHSFAIITCAIVDEKERLLS